MTADTTVRKFASPDADSVVALWNKALPSSQTCLLEKERDAEWMQAVAAEMNLSETAFVRPLDDEFELRWFTPAIS